MSSSRRSDPASRAVLILALAFVFVTVRGAGLHPHLHHHAPSQNAHTHADHQHSTVFAAESIGGGHYFDTGGIDLQQTVYLARLPEMAAAVFALSTVLFTLNPPGIPASALFDAYLYPAHSPPPRLRPPLRAPPL